MLACPRGAFCAGDANFNFTLCPRGTYQPHLAQSDCLRCPIGFMCPQEGMHVPRICPPGFVCDVTGTVLADQPCPEGHFCLEGTATTATTCGHPRPSSALFPTLSHAERTQTLRRGRAPEGGALVLAVSVVHARGPVHPPDRGPLRFTFFASRTVEPPRPVDAVVSFGIGKHIDFRCLFCMRTKPECQAPMNKESMSSLRWNCSNA